MGQTSNRSHETNPAGEWQIFAYGPVESTQDIALAEARSLLAAGELASARLAFMASSQLGGRGQFNRPWQSPEGGLYVSLLVGSPPAAFLRCMSIASGLAVCELLESRGITGAMLRWPNDVLVDDRKICGILTQTLMQGPLVAAVVGIGINLNTPLALLPANLRSRATSLLHITGRWFDRSEFLDALLTQMDAAIALAAEQGEAAVVERAARRDALRGRLVELQIEADTVSGIAGGFAPDGALLLSRDGRTQAVLHGSITAVDGRAIRAG